MLQKLTEKAKTTEKNQNNVEFCGFFCDSQFVINGNCDHDPPHLNGGPKAAVLISLYDLYLEVTYRISKVCRQCLELCCRFAYHRECSV